MQASDNPDSNDLRDLILGLQEEIRGLGQRLNRLEEKVDRVEAQTEPRTLDEKVEKVEYKFDSFQKGTDGMVRMATTIIIAAASVVVLSNITPSVISLVNTLAANNQ
ncbi:MULTISPECIES: hypothetical protein [unclassified Leptolyngbya]|uniref:hypothetical protein n=1 Tax=unclassified Leptolyngbya TaxID=2650499 RepID=UPI0016896A02|nr:MULTISPECIES: hypothetical protein [unclassified Leptolyngbya]MBD1910927.1 hypothetical protein [Leptolyngbya sp. FACHB-8]MBD2154972.1 hypothetical protein [Leptolyngbya sp. FACHB-16]